MALSVFTENSKVTVAKITSNSRIINDDERRVMLYSKEFKLESIVSSKIQLAPCLIAANVPINFWRADMNSNRSFERYIGRAKGKLENKQ